MLKKQITILRQWISENGYSVNMPKEQEHKVWQSVDFYNKLLILQHIKELFATGQIYTTPARIEEDNFNDYANSQVQNATFTVRSHDPYQVFKMLTNYLQVHKGCSLERTGEDTANVVFDAYVVFDTYVKS